MEKWDLYNAKREKSGITMCRGEIIPKGLYHLSVSVWIVNQQGQYLLSQRHPKKQYPLYWECTGGSVFSGETSLQGAIREVKEELGILLTPGSEKLIYQTRRENVQDFYDVWLFHRDIKIEEMRLQETEVVDVQWVSSDKLFEMFRLKQLHTVMGIVNEYSYSGFSKCFALPEQFMNEATGIDCTGTISVITDMKKYDTVEAALNQLIDGNSDLVMETIKESITYYSGLQQLSFGVLLIVAVIVVCFSLINLVNTTITNFLSRRQEIGMLQAIGLSKKQLIKMLCYEGLMYSVFATLVTLVLGTGLGFLSVQVVVKTMNPYFYYSFPWLIVLIYLAILLIVQFTLISYTTGNLKKQSLVEQIRTME